MTAPGFDIVVPTLGRPSLDGLLLALADEVAGVAARVILVDDRGEGRRIRRRVPAGLAERVEVVEGAGTGPASARNIGWRRSDAPWIVFLDDDVVPRPGWGRDLLADLATAGPRIGGVQGNLRVPVVPGRRLTDWERNVRGLEGARWATADMAYRRQALLDVGGFDERFPRAYREDADLALRIMDAGWSLDRGRRQTLHPVRPASPWISLRLQAGNADDAFMRVRHGRHWRARAEVPAGRRPRHFAVTGAGTAAVTAGLLGRRRWAAGLGLAWAAGTLEFAWARIAPGPKNRREVSLMLATSVAIPPLATWWWIRGWAAAHRGRDESVRPLAVLLDRDGTLVRDVPYNGDPARVEPMPGAQRALARLRHAGIRTAVISNQSGIGRGRLRRDDVEAVNRRVEELLGPLGPWCICPHGPDEGCGCRKPAPGLVLEAAAKLGVPPDRCVVVGDIGADVEAAAAAGARSVLVPTEVTRADEVAAAPDVAPDLDAAVDRILGETR